MQEEFDSVARFDLKMIPNGLRDRGLTLYAQSRLHFELPLYISDNVIPQRITRAIHFQAERTTIGLTSTNRMRTSKTISVSMPPAQLKQIERLAKKENRTMIELIREALRQYQQQQEARVNSDLIAALRAVQEDAKRVRLDRLSQSEINREVETSRREQRQKRIKKPV
ncbi:MAG: ribbon-helix-helix domain-containing protein [Bryobacteraceae bacterium]